MANTSVTTNHEEIKAWVEERGGFPAVRKHSETGEDLSVLRIDFPGFNGDGALERVEWDDWLEAFEQNELAFLHQDLTEEGEQSRFNKLIDRADHEE